MIEGKGVLVTGGTGSFGNAFVRRALELKPKRLVIYSRDEQKQDTMARELPNPDDVFRFFIGDVRDQPRLEMAMRGIDVVIHAAALKIIPSCEYNPFEAVNTNINGAENVIRSAIRAGVKRVVALSTDKACQPLNLYGATKLAAEKLFVAARNIVGASHPIFSVVRYGNVVGSRGSVIPLFTRLAAAGEALPITHTDMTRFWITLDQAVDLVFYALKSMKGGEIFIPRIPSMRVTDLADAIGPGLPRTNIGLRPGEKIHETLITEDEAPSAKPTGPGWILESGADNWTHPEGWSYNSKDNDQWLSVEELRKMLGLTDSPSRASLTPLVTGAHDGRAQAKQAGGKR